MHFFLFCLLPISIVLAYNSGIKCNGRITLGGLSDSYPNSTYYPKYWNQSLTPPFYETNQTCTWIIKIPDQKYVVFSMMADISGDSLLVITDCNGKTETIMTSEHQPFIFVGPDFTLDLTIGVNGNGTSLGFEVQWIDYPLVNTTQIDVSKNQSALLYDATLLGPGQTITAETKVSIVAFQPILPDFTPLLRLSLIFDGPNISSPFIGTLFQALRSNKPFKSTGNQMTIYTFDDDYSMGPDYIAMDYYNVENMNEVKGITCMSDFSCPMTLNALNGPASSMTLNVDDGDEFIKRLDLSDDAVLKVYIGVRKKDDDSNLIASYDVEQSQTNIPQKFNGAIMTYYLEKGTALVELAEDLNYTRWNDAVVGRKGFIASNNFGYASIGQNTFEYIGGLKPTDTFSYTVNVTFVDISVDSILTIGFESEDGIEKYVFSNENSSQTTVLTEVSGNLTVEYITNSTESRGFYLNFKIDAANSSSFHATFAVFFITLIAIIR